MAATTLDIDSSERFILPADSPYLANISLLWQSDPKLAELIESLDSPGPYTTQESRAKWPTLSVTTADGRTVFVHSRYQPIEESRRLVETVDAQQTMAYYVLGLGLGYHLELLFDQGSEEAIFCVFEPDLRMIRTALETRDLSRLLASNRILWFHTLDKAEMFQQLMPHTALISVGVATIKHPASQTLHESFFGQTEIWLDEFAAFVRTNMNTLLGNSTQTAQNIARNIGWYAATPSLNRLRDKYRNQPAVIVSAGPSLRKNKHLLAGLKNKAVLIAVQTTLQPLLEMGIEPHFVTSLDYHEICSRFFEKLPPNIRTELIAEPKATCKIFDLAPGPVTLVGNDFAEGLLREMNLAKPALPSGATVAHLAFYLAEFIGCDPIIFVGQDLGFSDGLCYTPGTSYEDVWRPELSRFCSVEMKQWEQIIRDRPILRQIPDQDGRPMYTEERLFAYLHQFERDFARSRARIIDATEGGARKRGARSMTLAEAIQTFCSSPLPSAEFDSPALQWNLLEQCRQSISQRLKESKEILAISQDTLPLLEEIRDNIEDQPRVNRNIARIDQLRARMDSLGRTYEQVAQFTQESELEKFKQDRKLAALRLTGMDKQKHQVQRDIDNVRAVIAAAGSFRDLMSEVCDRLKQQKEAA